MWKTLCRRSLQSKDRMPYVKTTSVHQLVSATRLSDGSSWTLFKEFFIESCRAGVCFVNVKWQTYFTSGSKSNFACPHKFTALYLRAKMNLHPQFQHLLSNFGVILFNRFGHNANQQLWVSWKSAQGGTTFLWAAYIKLNLHVYQHPPQHLSLTPATPPLLLSPG